MHDYFSASRRGLRIESSVTRQPSTSDRSADERKDIIFRWRLSWIECLAPHDASLFMGSSSPENVSDWIVQPIAGQAEVLIRSVAHARRVLWHPLVDAALRLDSSPFFRPPRFQPTSNSSGLVPTSRDEKTTLPFADSGRRWLSANGAQQQCK